MRKILLVVGCSLLLVSNVFAVNPTERYFGNTGGVDEALHPTMIADNEAAEIVNCYFDEGSIIKRDGYNKLNTTLITNTPDFTGLYDYQVSNGTRKLIGCTSNGKIYKMDALDGTWDDITSNGGKMTAATIAFVDSNPDTITDAGAGFVTAGFKAGDTVIVTGSVSNDGTYTIDAGGVAAGTLTLIATDTLTGELAGATVTLKGGDFTNDLRWTFATAPLTAGPDPVCIMMNGTDYPVYWNGTDATVTRLPDLGGVAGTMSPINHYQIYYDNRVFAAGLSTNPSRLHYTAINEADDWTNGGTLEIGTGDGQEITGLAASKYAGTDTYDKLVVFKDNSIYLVDTSDANPTNWRSVKISSEVGCVSNWSIQNIADKLAWLDIDGLYVLDGIMVNFVSDRISATIDSLADARLSEAISVVNKDYDHYLLSVSSNGATEHDTIICYDYLLNVFCGTWDGINANAMADVIVQNTGENRVYFGDYYGTCWQLYTNTNDGVPSGTQDGTATSGGNTTLTDTAATFYTTGSGLAGCTVTIRAGTGSGQSRLITSNTADTLTITPAWTTNPAAGSTYGIGDIDALYVSKMYVFGAIEWLKRVMYMYLFAYSEGNWDIEFGWSRDAYTTFASKDVTLDAGSATWNSFEWGDALWGASGMVRERIDINSQCWALQLQFRNRYGDEPFQLYGWSFNYQPMQRDDY